jgi:sorbose reductase
MALAGPPKETNVLSLFRLNGKVAVITGGTRGIGWDAARAMAEAGAHVALIYTSYPDPTTRVTEIQSLGVTCRAYQSNISDPSSISETLDKVVADFGKIDIVIANAGVCKHTDSLEYTVEYWRQETGININGSFFTAQAAGRIFKRQGFGNLLFTTSISGSIVNWPQRQAAYNASKAAVIQLAKSLAVEWIDFARVNTLSPGYIETDMTATNSREMLEEWDRRTPARRMATPAELKGGFLYLVSDASSYRY